MMTRLEKRLQEQRKSRKRHTRLILAGIVAVFLIAIPFYFWFGGGAGIKKSKRAANLSAAAAEKINILVLGVDERKGDKGRSDTIFVVTVDTGTKDVSLLSIPRDTRVKIPRYGWDKINHAYNAGGHELSQAAVEDLLGVPIDYYAVINFANFHKIVDAVGGVTLDVDKRMYYRDPYDDLVIDIKPGVQRLNGETAIQYVRYRDEEGDIGRIERQQKFIKAMLAEVSSPAVIVRLPGIIREVGASIQTDLSVSDMLNLAKLINDAQKSGLKADMVPGQPAYINEVSYWLPDVVALREHVAQILGISADAKFMSEARRLATEYVSSIPKEMKVVERPKPEAAKSEAAQAAALPQQPKPSEKSAQTSLPPAPPATAKIRVEVVNASGVPDAGGKVADIMRKQGFEVVSVSASASTVRNTIVISHTTNSNVVGKLTGLPFKYVLQVTKDSSTVPVTVIVGRDFDK